MFSVGATLVKQFNWNGLLGILNPPEIAGPIVTGLNELGDVHANFFKDIKVCEIRKTSFYYALTAKGLPSRIRNLRHIRVSIIV